MAQKGGYILKALNKRKKKNNTSLPDLDKKTQLPTINGKKPDMEAGKKASEKGKSSSPDSSKSIKKKNESLTSNRRHTNVDARTGTNTAKPKTPAEYNKKVAEQKAKDKRMSVLDAGRINSAGAGKPKTDLELAKDIFEAPNYKSDRQKDIENHKKKPVQTWRDNPNLLATNTNKNNGGTWEENRAKHFRNKAQKAYDEGDEYHGDKYSAKSSEMQTEADTIREQQELAHTLDNNEIALIRTAALTGNPDITKKVLQAAEDGAYTNEKAEDNPYAGVTERYANQAAVNYAKAPFSMGVIEGTNLIPLTQFQIAQANTGLELDPTAKNSMAYRGGEMASMLGIGAATGALTAGEKILGNGIKKGFQTFMKNAKNAALVDAPINLKQSVAETVEDNAAGKQVPQLLGDTDISTEEGKDGWYMTNDTEPGANKGNTGGLPKSVNKWNDDIVADAMSLPEDKQKNLEWGQDKYGYLHYSTNGTLADILEYYNNATNPEYTLKEQKYTSPGAMNSIGNFGKNLAINTALSGGMGGLMGGVGKTAKNGAKEAGKAVKEGAEEVAPKVVDDVGETVKVEKPKAGLDKSKAKGKKPSNKAKETAIDEPKPTEPKVEEKPSTAENKPTEAKEEKPKSIGSGENTYKVKAKDESGNEVTIEVKAKNKTEARNTAKENGYKVGKGKENVEATSKEKKPPKKKPPKKEEKPPEDPAPRDAKIESTPKEQEAAIKSIDKKKDTSIEGNEYYKFKDGSRIIDGGIFDDTAREGVEQGAYAFRLIGKDGKRIGEYTEDEIKNLIRGESLPELPKTSTGADKIRPLETAEDLAKKGKEYKVEVEKPDGTTTTVTEVALNKKSAIEKAEQQTGGKVVTELSKKNRKVYHAENQGRVGTIREGDLPKKTQMGEVQQGADTVHDSNVTRYAKDSEKARHYVEQGVADGDYWKTQVSSKELAKEKAEAVAKDVKSEHDLFTASVVSDKRITSEDLARGWALADHYAKAGDYEAMESVLADVSQMASEAGRTLQAMKVFERLHPTGRQKSIDRMVKNIERSRNIKIDRKSDEYKKLVQAVLDAGDDSEKLVEANSKLAKHIWDQVPPSVGEKLATWRYLSMLGNPKTHIRNIFGNAMMKPVRATSDAIAAAIEKNPVVANKFKSYGVKGTKGTTLTKDRKQMMSWADDVYTKHRAEIEAGQTKYLDRQRPLDSDVFKRTGFRWINKAAKWNGTALDKEDLMFSKSAFKKAFASYCNKNGYKAANITDGQMAEAIDYAARKGAEATYREANELAEMLNHCRQMYLTPKAKDSKTVKLTKKAAGMFFDSALPFVKTPANILKQGIAEYSPIGVLRGISKIAKSTSAEELAKGIEVLSSGLVGSVGLTATGAYLALNDMAHGKIGEYTDKVASYKKLLGDQDYSIEINGTRIDLDWVAPQSIPFFVGVEIASSVQKVMEDSEYSTVDQAMAIAQGLVNSTDPIFEMSMLSGLSNIFETTFSGNTIKEMGVNTAENYVSQMFPTLGNQVAKYFTPDKRTALATDELPMVKEGKKFGKTIANKVPWFRGKFGDEAVDVWGRTDNSDYINGSLLGQKSNPLKQAGRVFLNPATMTKNYQTEVDSEIMRLYEKTNDDSVIPSWGAADYIIKYDDQVFRMTPDEFVDYKKELGHAKYEAVQELMNTKDWNAFKKGKDGKFKLDKNGHKIPVMSDEEKIKAITDAWSNLKTEAKGNYLVGTGKVSQEKWDADHLSEWIHFDKNADVVDLYEDGKLTIEEAKAIVGSEGSGTKATAYTLAKKGNSVKELTDLGIGQQTAEKMHYVANSGVDYDKMVKDLSNKKAIKQFDGYKVKGKGTPNGKLDTADEIQAYLKTKNWSNDKKWTYLYANSGVSAKSRSKYGY